MNENQGPLRGIRVLDLSQMLAGPICGMRLGDMGADVLKIEPPGTGEWTRTHGFAGAAIKGHTTAFLGLNRNKRSVAINLKDPEGLDVFHQLVKRSDALIQNFRVGTAERLGVGYEQLREINPKLVYGSISGYGETGPYRDRPGQDLLVQAMSGSMWSVGRRSDPPMPGALWAVDAMTGYQLALGIVAALRGVAESGVGQKVSVNMLSVVMDCQCQELMTAFNLGMMPERSENPFAHAWVTAPYAAYQTKDGWMVISQSPLHVLGEALGNERLRQFTDWNDGVTHRDEIYTIVKDVLPSKTTAEWVKIFDVYKLWSGPVYNYQDLENDPQVQATGMVTEIEHPEIGRLKMQNVPLQFSSTPASVRTPPPLLGEHTSEVLREFTDCDADRLVELRKRGVIQ